MKAQKDKQIHTDRQIKTMRGKGRDGRTELRGRVVWKSVNNKMEHEGGDEKN